MFCALLVCFGEWVLCWVGSDGVALIEASELDGHKKKT